MRLPLLCGSTAVFPAWRGKYREGLAKELGVEVVDEDFFDACFGEAVLAIHGDELAAYALQLRERHGRGWKLDGFLHILDFYLASSFSLVVLLVCHDLGKDVGRRLVELVEVILLRRGFLWMLDERVCFGMLTYQHSRQVGFDGLQLAVAANERIPYLLARRRGVLLDDDEQRAVPPRHAVGLLVPKDEVLEVFVLIAAVVLRVCQQLLVVLATSIGRRSYMQL